MRWRFFQSASSRKFRLAKYRSSLTVITTGIVLLSDTGESPKADASIIDSALSHTRRSDASEKREENSVSTFGHFRLWTSFESTRESSPVLETPKSQI